MKRQWQWISVFLSVLCGLPPVTSAAQKGKQTQAQKNEEKKEDEAVRKAQQSVKAAQDAENAAERQAKKAVDELKSAERGLVQAASNLKKVREDLEDKHAEAAGLAAARKNADAARKAYEAAGQPVLQRLAETAKHKQAVEAAKAAEQRLVRLRSEADGNADDRIKQSAEAARVKLVPGQLEREALDADSSLKPHRDKMVTAEEAVAAARKTADRLIDKDPALKAAIDKIDRAKEEVASSRRTAGLEEKQLVAARQKLAKEQQELQQKIAADKRDDNKTAPKKNKN